MGSIGNFNAIYEIWTDKDAKKEYSKYDYDVTSPEWRDSTKYVGGGYYSSIQRALFTGEMKQSTFRDGIVDMTPYIKNLDKSMRSLSKNVQLVRTLTYDQVENNIGIKFDTIQKITDSGSTDYKVLDKMVGKTFSRKGYMSTSYQESQNAMQGAQVMFEIKVPKGTKAIVTGNKMESEIILNRGLKYKITGYRVKTLTGTRKQVIVEAKIIN